MRWSAGLLVLCAAAGCAFDVSGIGPGNDNGPMDDGAVPGQSDAAPGNDAGVPADAGPCIAPGVLCDFAWKSKITLDNTGIGSRLDDVPVLLTLDNDRIDYGSTQLSGEDLRFYSADLTDELDYEIEYWEPLGKSFVWVEVPRIEPQGQPPTDIYMFYGNLTAPPGQRPAGVWSNDYESVHHFHNVLLDSTGNGHDGSSPAKPTPTVAARGIIAGAMEFDGTSQYLELAGEQEFDFTKDFAVSAWIRVAGFEFDYQTIVAKGDSAWRLHRDLNRDQLAFDNHEDGGSPTNHNGNTRVNDGVWHFVLATYDGSKKEMYIDGVRDLSRNYTGTVSKNDFLVAIGDNRDPGALGDRFFHGLIDEVRISRVPRDQSWATVQFRSVTDPTFATFGTAERP